MNAGILPASRFCLPAAVRARVQIHRVQFPESFANRLLLHAHLSNVAPERVQLLQKCDFQILFCARIPNRDDKLAGNPRINLIPCNKAYF